MSAASRVSRFTRWLFVCVLYSHGASALLHAFMSQWGRQIGESLRAALSNELPRPFAYRMLTPAIVNILESATPSRIRESILDYRDFLGQPVIEQAARHYNWGGTLEFSFVSLNVCLFLVFFALAFVWRSIARASVSALGDEGGRMGKVLVDFLPMIAFLLLPITFVRGGYLYDPLDLLLGSLGFLFFVRRRWVAYYLCLAVALFNKESSVLWIGWFAAFLVADEGNADAGFLRSVRKSRLKTHVLAHVILGGLAILILYSIHADQAGAPVQHRFSENLPFWASGIWLTTVQDTHAASLPLPASLNVVNLILLIGLWRCARGRVPRRLSWALIGAIACVLPLFIPFGFRDEIRVFSATVIPVLVAISASFLVESRERSGVRRLSADSP